MKMDGVRGRNWNWRRSRAKLVSWSHAAPGNSGDVQTQLLLRAMMGSMVLTWLGSELMSGSCLSTNDHVEVQGWGNDLSPW